jgi:acyl carrier protein
VSVAYENVESLLNALWCETLRLPSVAAADNFIDLGGNSLAAMRIAAKVKDAWGVDVPMSVILGDGTLQELASAVFALIRSA